MESIDSVLSANTNGGGSGGGNKGGGGVTIDVVVAGGGLLLVFEGADINPGRGFRFGKITTGRVGFVTAFVRLTSLRNVFSFAAAKSRVRRRVVVVVELLGSSPTDLLAEWLLRIGIGVDVAERELRRRAAIVGGADGGGVMIAEGGGDMVVVVEVVVCSRGGVVGGGEDVDRLWGVMVDNVVVLGEVSTAPLSSV